MKKYIYILLTFLLLPFVVNAEELSISNPVLISNSTTAGVLSEPTIDGLNLNFDFNFKNKEDTIKYEFIVHNVSSEDYIIELDNTSVGNIDYSINTNTIKRNSDTKIELTATYNKDTILIEDYTEVNNLNISMIKNIDDSNIGKIIVYSIAILLTIFFTVLVFKINKKLLVTVPFVALLMFLLLPKSYATPFIGINNNVTILKNSYCESFQTDDWSQISRNIKSGSIDCYNIGDTKEVTLENLGTFNIKLVNTSTPESCNLENASTTNCGFILEFNEVVTLLPINETPELTGKFVSSTLNRYLNDTIYSSLPEELQNIIVDTKIGNDDFSYTSTLYLLSESELIGENALDYYKTTEVLDKTYNGEITSYWTRDEYIYNPTTTYIMINNNTSELSNIDTSNGIAPAFRIN